LSRIFADFLIFHGRNGTWTDQAEHKPAAADILGHWPALQKNQVNFSVNFAVIFSVNFRLVFGQFFGLLPLSLCRDLQCKLVFKFQTEFFSGWCWLGFLVSTKPLKMGDSIGGLGRVSHLPETGEIDISFFMEELTEKLDIRYHSDFKITFNPKETKARRKEWSLYYFNEFELWRQVRTNTQTKTHVLAQHLPSCSFRVAFVCFFTEILLWFDRYSQFAAKGR
jgi:hypothetical protein